MVKRIAAILQEALAIIGVGLFAFGVWQIYHPAMWLFLGFSAMAPFISSELQGLLVVLRKGK